MLDLVPFTLDQISAVKMGDGLTWGVQGGGSLGRVAASQRLGRAPLSSFLAWMPAACTRGLLGVSKAGSRTVTTTPGERLDFFREKSPGFGYHSPLGGDPPVFPNNIAKPMTSLQLSSMLSHS